MSEDPGVNAEMADAVTEAVENVLEEQEQREVTLAAAESAVNAGLAAEDAQETAEDAIITATVAADIAAEARNGTEALAEAVDAVTAETAAVVAETQYATAEALQALHDRVEALETQPPRLRVPQLPEDEQDEKPVVIPVGQKKTNTGKGGDSDVQSRRRHKFGNRGR